VAVWWAIGSVLLTLLHGLLIVPRLPEPPDGADLGKLTYAALITPRRLAGLATMTVAAQAVMPFIAPEGRPLWLVYNSAVAALVWVDACTTWLPSKLSWLVTAELTAAAVVALILTTNRPQLAAQLLLGAGVAWLLWWTFYHISRGGFGFGDVRLAPLTGAMAATMGASGWFAALLASSVLGALWGLVASRRRPAPGTATGFAYGPWLWVGPYVALAWAVLT